MVFIYINLKISIDKFLKQLYYISNTVTQKSIKVEYVKSINRINKLFKYLGGYLYVKKITKI